MVDKDDQLTQVAFGVAEATDEARDQALRELEADSALHAKWISGLATNRSAPDDILRRVFTLDPLPDGVLHWLRHCCLAPVAVKAAVTHPDPLLRKSVTENSFLPPDALALLTEDPDPGVRWRAVMMASERNVTLPTELAVRLATGPDAVKVGGGHRDPQVRLLGVLRPEPTRRRETGITAACDPDAGRAHHFHTVRGGVGPDVCAQQVGVELRQGLGVGAVEGDYGHLLHGHAARLPRVSARTRPLASRKLAAPTAHRHGLRDPDFAALAAFAARCEAAAA